MELRSVGDLKNIKGKRVLLRLDLNVPIERGTIKDDYRIRRSMKTLDYLRQEGARVLIIAHIESAGNNSLVAVAKSMGLPFFDIHSASFSSDDLSFVKEGEAVILENLRKDPGEKKNDPLFTKKLASLGEIYVNEAFSASHREHASIVGLPSLLPSYFGFLFIEEVANLSRAFAPVHPFVFILGGAKFETKLPLVEKFLHIADKVFICGALANSFYKEKGMEIGRSRADDINLGLKELLDNDKVVLPEDAIVVTDKCRCIKDIKDLEQNDLMGDAGPKFREVLDTAVLSARFVLWNGPLGIIEEGFVDATHGLAKTIAISNAISVVGGGDTVSAIKGLDIEDRISFVSTGGGAMLDFLAKGTLPGIDAISKHA